MRYPKRNAYAEVSLANLVFFEHLALLLRQAGASKLPINQEIVRIRLEIRRRQLALKNWPILEGRN
jgi:hypothetical protein